MAYSNGRRILDADSHLMDRPDWLLSYVDPAVRPRIEAIEKPIELRAPEHEMFLKKSEEYAQQRANNAAVATAAEGRLMEDKLYAAMGAFDPHERAKALDLLGFERQFVFATASLSAMGAVETDLAYAVARGHNRGMAEFCSVDSRLLGVSWVPMNDAALAVAELDRVLEEGTGAVMVPTVPPADGPSPTHSTFDPFWARLEEAGVPFVLHVGFNLRPTGGWNTVPRGYQFNERPPVKGLRPGGETPDAYSFMAIHHPPSLFLSYLIFDGVLERFPRLRGACIEQSATWVPSWMHQVDLAVRGMSRLHPYFDDLTMRPSEYVRRQIKFTPFYFERIGWIIEQAGPEVLMFASDYPHVEGGNDPIAVFDKALEGVSEEVRERFFCGNMAELLGLDVTV